MPQRFLRPGITTSDGWNLCSWPAQSLYIRIMTLVDDFGRYDARIPILHGQCFALRPDVKPQQTAAFRSELQRNGLILVYSVEGKEFLQVTKWKERVRSELSHWPGPNDSAAVRSDPLPPEPSPSPSPSPLHHRNGDGFDEFWKSYPKKVGKKDAFRAWQRAKDRPEIPAILNAVITQSASDQWRKDGGQFIPNPATWLNEGRWMDEIPKNSLATSASIRPSINSIAQADSVLKEIELEISRLLDDEKSFTYVTEPTPHKEYNPQVKIQISGLRARKDEIRKLKLGLKT